ncbi:site-specific integrase [uncultured Streptococcus sp.]|uniref:tyrosine-type recombinase/integrase n=1 Tax=uncultured Streptococcus sp. TaxID=83427 RepID=UPI0027DD97B2|nr:site-specific integrase [uncultured Streptococcus sp.]
MTIKQFKKKNGDTVYRQRVYLGTDSLTGKQVQVTITGRTAKEVSQKATKKLADFKMNGSTVLKIQQVNNYGDLVTLWLSSYKLTVKPQTYRHTEITIHKHLVPVFGTMKLDKISLPFVQYFANTIAASGLKEYKPIIALNKRILQYAVHLQLITRNPAENIIIPKAQKLEKEVKHLDNEQLKIFLDYLEQLPNTYKNNYNAVLYRFLLATGLRIGEAVALEWSDIDLEDGTISVTKTFNPVINELSTPKTRAGKRVISIDRKTMLMLRLYKVRQEQKFKEMISPYGQHVFSNGLAPYPFRNNLQRMLDDHLEKAGLPRFTFHAFRHTHASLLLNAGITYKELQHRLGHSKISMTLDVYSHLSKDKEKEAVTYYEKALGKL